MARFAKKAKASRRPSPRPKPPSGTMAALIEDIALDVRYSPETGPQPQLLVSVRLRLADSFRSIRAVGLVVHEAAIGETTPCKRNLDMIEALVRDTGNPPLADLTTESLRGALLHAPVVATLSTLDAPTGPLPTITDIVAYKPEGAAA